MHPCLLKHRDVTALVEALLDTVPSGARENAHAEELRL